MPFLMTRVPLTPADVAVPVGGLTVELHVYQPVVWVQLVPWRGYAAGPAVPFPAVVDTGNNDVFLLSASRFRAWAGADPSNFTPRHRRKVNGVWCGCYPFNLDLLRGPAAGSPLVRLESDQGVAVVPAGDEHRFPPTPVLGVRCLTVNRLTFSVTGDRRSFSVWRPAPRP